jgi:hypothetical protein
VIGTILAQGGQPGSDASPAKVILYFTSGSHRDRIALGWFLLVVGAMMVAASLALLGSRRGPSWAAWLGVIAGISALASVFYIPWFVIAVWLVVASVLVVRAHAEEDPSF